MREPMSLPVDIIDEIERRARLEGVQAEVVASRLVAEELPHLVADLLRPDTQNVPEPELRNAVNELDSTPFVELNPTARRRNKGASGASTT